MSVYVSLSSPLYVADFMQYLWSYEFCVKRRKPKKRNILQFLYNHASCELVTLIEYYKFSYKEDARRRN